MKKVISALILTASTSVFASGDIVANVRNIVESQYGLKCGESFEMKQAFFKPIRQREQIACKDSNDITQVIIQTEAKAKGSPLYKVQILSGNSKSKL